MRRSDLHASGGVQPQESDTRPPLYTTVVIVHFGDSKPTIGLVRSLQLLPALGDIVVVANDQTPRPSELDDAVCWVVPKRNLGFAGGFEEGCMARPTSDVYLLLNNDLRLAQDCLSKCLQVFDDPSIGVVAPLLFNSDGLQSAAGRVSRILFKGTTKNVRPNGVIWDAEWVTGAVMFIRRDCLDQAGFDLSFFLGWEDADFCFRARRNGWRVVIASQAQAWHEGCATIPGPASNYYFLRNRVWFSRRWSSSLRAGVLWLWIALVLFPRVLLADFAKRRGYQRSICAFHAVVDGARSLPPADAVADDEPRPAGWHQWS